MAYKLVQVAGNLSLELPAERPVTVGRSVTCDLVVNEPTLSRVHAEISPIEGGLMLKDMGSRNGTFLNNSRIGMAMVMPGDVIGFGEARFNVTEISEAAETSEPELSLPPEEQIPEPELPEPELPEPELPEPEIPEPEIPEPEIPEPEIPEPEIPEPELPEPEITQVPTSAVEPPASPVAESPPAAERSQPPPVEFQVTAVRTLDTGDPLATIEDVQKLRLLLNLSKELYTINDTELLLEKVAAQVFERMNIDRVGLRLNAADTSKRTVQLFTSAVASAKQAFEIPETIAEQAISERAAISATKTDENSAAGMHSALCVPLIDREGDILGLFYVDTLAALSAYTEEELDFLIALANVAATAFERFRR